LSWADGSRGATRAARVLIGELYSAGLRLIFRLPVRDVDSVRLYVARRSEPAV